jgi:hypothetical protein
VLLIDAMAAFCEGPVSANSFFLIIKVPCCSGQKVSSSTFDFLFRSMRVRKRLINVFIEVVKVESPPAEVVARWE